VVEARGDVREKCGAPIVLAGHHGAEAEGGGVPGEGCEGGVAFEAVGPYVLLGEEEVVRDPDGLEAEPLRLQGDLLDVIICETELGLDLDPEIEVCHGSIIGETIVIVADYCA